MLDQNKYLETKMGRDHILANKTEAVCAVLTDTRGMIGSVNDYFCELSANSREELRGASFRNIRHPEMPRGVFHVMWERLKKGEPVFSYILNKSSDGQTFSIFSIIMPYANGYFSLGIEPRSEFFPKQRKFMRF